MKQLFTILILLLSLKLIAQNKLTRKEEVRLMTVDSTSYKTNDFFYKKNEKIVLIEWTKRNNKYFWKCSDGKLYHNSLIDYYKNK